MKTTSFTTVTSIIKYLGLTLATQMENLYEIKALHLGRNKLMNISEVGKIANGHKSVGVT